MKRPPSLIAAMTPFPYSVGLHDSVEQVQGLMERHHVRHLPVTEGRTVVGLITDRDLQAVLGASGSSLEGARPLLVKDLQMRDPYVVELNAPMEKVLSTMAERHADAAVVTREGKLAGVFTWVNACRCFAEYIRHGFPKRGDDEVA